MASTQFRAQFPFQQRTAEARKVMRKFPDRVPVIIERASTGDDVPLLRKRKYLVPRTLTVGQFVHLIRGQLSLPPQQAIFVFAHHILPPTAMLVADEPHDVPAF